MAAASNTLPTDAAVAYSQKVLGVAFQLREHNEGGTMSELVQRADEFLRTGKLPEPVTAAPK